VVVKRGGQRIEPSLYGTPLPVDPGEYRVEVSAPGYEVWSTPITVAAGGGSASVRVPGLVKAPEAPAPTSAAPPADAPGPTPAAASDAPMATASSQGLSTQQTLGLAVGGVGVIGVGLGSYFGVRAISRNSDAEEHCPDNLCNREGLTLTDDADKDASFANIAFIAGGVLLTTGAVLFLTGGRSDASADRVALVPTVAPNLAAATLVGRF
jgi:serine/threonine-protein kinase